MTLKELTDASIILPMNSNNRHEFNAHAALVASRKPVAVERRRTPRPMSRPEREIRQMRRYSWVVIACGTLAAAFPLYVLAVEVFVK